MSFDEVVGASHTSHAPDTSDTKKAISWRTPRSFGLTGLSPSSSSSSSGSRTGARRPRRRSRRDPVRDGGRDVHEPPQDPSAHGLDPGHVVGAEHDAVGQPRAPGRRRGPRRPRRGTGTRRRGPRPGTPGGGSAGWRPGARRRREGRTCHGASARTARSCPTGPCTRDRAPGPVDRRRVSSTSPGPTSSGPVVISAPRAAASCWAPRHTPSTGRPRSTAWRSRSRSGASQAVVVVDPHAGHPSPPGRPAHPRTGAARPRSRRTTTTSAPRSPSTAPIEPGPSWATCWRIAHGWADGSRRGGH